MMTVLLLHNHYLLYWRTVLCLTTSTGLRFRSYYVTQRYYVIWPCATI